MAPRSFAGGPLGRPRMPLWWPAAALFCSPALAALRPRCVPLPLGCGSGAAPWPRWSAAGCGLQRYWLPLGRRWARHGRRLVVVLTLLLALLGSLTFVGGLVLVAVLVGLQVAATP